MVEAVECPTLLMNGYGEHNIQGIGDKHVPLIHNVMNTDLVIGVSDQATDGLNAVFNTDAGHHYLARRLGVAPELVRSLRHFGLSSIANILGAIKMAKHGALGPDDAIVTVATDGHEMYQSELQRYLKRRHNTGELTSEVAAEIVGQHLIGAGTEHVLDATARERERIFNLGYFTWVEQQGIALADFDRRRSQAFWRGLHDLVPQWDEDLSLQSRQRHGRSRLTRDEEKRARMSTETLVKPYQQLRKATLDRDRGLREKVMSLEEAAELVHDGDHVGIGGCTMSRTPIAMIWALIRARKKDLTISRSITSTEGDLLFASGVSKHVITSWFTQGIVWGVSKVMRHYTEQKLARFDEWSHMSIGLRYRAGAMGIPFMPSRSMIGSDVGKRVGDEIKTMTCPFTGEGIVLLPALNPDVVLIHVQRCDAYGNAQLDGLQFMDIDMAMAANRVILTTERIVSNDQIRRTPDLTRIPFFTVEAVVEAPMGCAPHECYGLYEPFFSHMDDYAERTSKDPVKGCQQYLEEFYYAPKSWPDYLSKIGMEAVLDACRRGRSVHND